ncbi:MAG: hypothetical protein Q4F73_02775 [Corynebacterium sp.]|nr:hypothetical protein [Corynebacterium sp.]
MDAGPGLTFFSARQERLLFQIVGPVSIPEIVRAEIAGKARRDSRFHPASTVMGRLPDTLLRVLSDTPTPELARAVHRLSGQKFDQRQLEKKDLGETMVIAHAVVSAEAGENVIVMIDEGEGTRVAIREAERLERLRTAGAHCGSLRLLSTLDILSTAIRRQVITDRGHLRKIYAQFRTLDDGLVRIEDTPLLSPQLWSGN